MGREGRVEGPRRAHLQEPGSWAVPGTECTVTLGWYGSSRRPPEHGPRRTAPRCPFLTVEAPGSGGRWASPRRGKRPPSSRCVGGAGRRLLGRRRWREFWVNTVAPFAETSGGNVLSPPLALAVWWGRAFSKNFTAREKNGNPPERRQSVLWAWLLGCTPPGRVFSPPPSSSSLLF